MTGLRPKGNKMSNWTSVDSSFNGESIKATDIEVGESVEGKVTAITEHKEYGSFFLFIENSGEVTRVFTAGNLTYKVKDGKIAVGNTYKITRLADTPPKKKGAKPRTTFEVLVDQDSLAPVLPAI
jgi:hypothetical protein